MFMNYLDELVKTIQILRSPQGCPWDREQTHSSIRENMLEEAYEAVEAIDEKNPEHLKEELGDVLLQVLLHSQIAKDEGEFDIQDVAKMLNDKLIYRHPHVFKDTNVKNSNDVVVNWEKLKEKEKPQRKNTLDGIAKTLPSLMRAMKISKKAARKGIEWAKFEDVLACFKSEIEEFLSAESQKEKEEEFGDILFSLVNVARWSKIDPEFALQIANEKFRQRFTILENLANKPLDELSIEEYDILWQQAKKLQKNS